MALWILRGVFMLIAIGLAMTLTATPEFYGPEAEVAGQSATPFGRWLLFGSFLLGAVATVLLDVLIEKKRIDMITSVYFGLLVGLFLTYIVNLALAPLFGLQESFAFGGTQIPAESLRSILVGFAGVCLCYGCVSMLWQTRNDFRFVIPYVEFTKDVKGSKPYVLDTSVVIDGRIADVLETGIIDNKLIMPRFVLAELQAVADSNDRLRRSRGRRGLDILDRLRKNNQIDFEIYERELPEMQDHPVDMKLLMLARHLDGKVVTGDFNLNKVAKLQNVPVINLNEIANSLKPVFLPGELIKIKIVKAGEGPTQGVGYLDDGTMIVVDEGRQEIGNEVGVTVSSMLQTSAGRMVFAKLN